MDNTGCSSQQGSIPLLEAHFIHSYYQARFRHSFNKSTIKCSIIIPAFNKLELTRQCLSAIIEHTPDALYDVIVVDNASTDGTKEFLSTLEGDVKIITNKENLGFAKACNQGAQAATGEYLVFLNNDTIPHQNWLTELVDIVDAFEDVGIVGSKLLFSDGTIQHAGVAMIPVLGHMYRHSPSDFLPANKPRDFNVVTAACMLIRKDLFFAVGGFHEGYINGCEDIDLCLSVRAAGKRVFYNPRSVLTHFEAQTPGREDRMDENRKLLFERWRERMPSDYEKYLFDDGFRKSPTDRTKWEYHDDLCKRTVSIIIVTYNSLTDIVQCLSSIQTHTNLPYEVIIIDNNSTDGTRDYLKNLKGFHVIMNDENIGFVKACNQGIQIARGEYIVLLNPDTAVTTDWAWHMLLHFKKGVGAVGPVSNYVAGKQKCELYLKDNFSGDINIDHLAQKIYAWNRGRSVETKLLIGFCLMLSKEVVDKVGMLDEDLFLGNDDLELSLRIRNNGYSLLVATDTFIYHKGQASFKTEKVSTTSRLLQESADKLYEKLENIYGKDNIPSTRELWDLDDWFVRPSQVKPVAQVSSDETFTGERAMPLAANMDKAIMQEHWARYTKIVPLSKGKRVLDIACGAGYGSNLLAQSAQSVMGGDISLETITYCKKYYQKPNLKFGVMDIRNLPFADHCFDLVVSFETLEHIVEGDLFLKEICRILSNDGTLAISTPFGGPCGNPYHMAYYQKGTFEKFLLDYFEEVKIEYQRGNQFNSSSISPGYCSTFTGEYALAVCQKPRKAFQKLTSIIILTHNQLKYTKKCLESIDLYTPERHELFLVDNGSTDGTTEFLKKYAQMHDNVRLIINETNLGYAAGNNLAIDQCTGDYILFLNNDVVVTEGWLGGLSTVLDRYPDFGMVGPVSNSVSGIQLIETSNYDSDMKSMQNFAKKLKKDRSGTIQEALRLVGFCLLVRKEVIDIIGGFDEGYQNGNFEDDDLCLRSHIAGFKHAIANDIFIHHFGSMTFKGNAIDHQATMKDNRQYFTGKWKDLIEVSGNGYRVRFTKEQQLKKLIEWGEERFSQGDVRSALKIFERTLHLDRTNSQALNNIGVIQWQLGDTISAMNTFQISLTINPKDPDALGNLVQAATKTERFDLLKQNLLDILKQEQPENPDIVKLINAQQSSACTI